MTPEQRKHSAVAPSCAERGAGFLRGESDPTVLCRAAEQVVARGEETQRSGRVASGWARVQPPGSFPTVRFDPVAVVRPTCLPVPTVEAVGPTSWGERIAQVAPGPDLAALVAGLDPAGVATQDMVELVAAADRLAAWVHYQRARWARELADRPEMHPWRTPGVRPQDGCVAADELAMRLGVSRNATSTMVTEGDAFASVLHQTGQALQAGAITPAKARGLTRRLPDLPVPVAQEVEDLVLPEAATRTVSQLSRDVEKALLRVDAGGAVSRGVQARAGRRVCHPRALPDGMASMYVELPAPDAMRLDGVLESTARTLRAAGDGRTPDQARADTLCDLVFDRPSFTVEHLATPARTVGAATPGDVDVAGGCTGAGNRGGGAAMLGGMTVSHGVAVGGAHGTVAGDGAGVGPGPGCAPVVGDHRAAGCRLATVTGVEGVTVPRCRRPHATAAIQVTVALTTLAGLDERPADLHGYGPIGADQARQIAHEAGSTWRRIVTDPLTGAVLDVGRSRYTPPAPLAAHVRARDRRCAAPGCDVPAIRCDIDHTVEFYGVPNGPPAPRGTTSSCNLGPLCPVHHRLKTDRGFVLRQSEPGVFTWTTPAGHRYRTRPGMDTGYEHLDQRDRPWPRPPMPDDAQPLTPDDAEQPMPDVAQPPTPDDEHRPEDPGCGGDGRDAGNDNVNGDRDRHGGCGRDDGDNAGGRVSEGSDSGASGVRDGGDGGSGGGAGGADRTSGGDSGRVAGAFEPRRADGSDARPNPTDDAADHEDDEDDPDRQHGHRDLGSRTPQATWAAINRILPGLLPADPAQFDREPPF